MNHHPKLYLILVKTEMNKWTIRAQYELSSTAELHALEILKDEKPDDLMIVKNLNIHLCCGEK